MKKIVVATIMTMMAGSVSAQLSSSDSAQSLDKVTVTAFEQNRRLVEIPASIALINKTQLQRFAPFNVLQAFNSLPGVRMEERSPGSYRMNIRGSSLRSPFGVRNVKIYYNDLPYTTPGGDSYFNQLGFYNFNTVEIIKGPGSSLYGAGTGGVMLIRSDDKIVGNSVTLSAAVGSYGTKNFHLQAKLASGNTQQTIDYQSQYSDGYRDHTAMNRDVLSWQLKQTGEKGQFNAQFLYSNLYYQTPGGLNKREFDSASKMARPNAGFIPGAETAKAAIYQKTFYSGMSYTYKFSESFQQTTAMYGAYTQLNNPGIFAYSRAIEPHFGGRTVFQFKQKGFSAHLGAEVQQGYSNAKAYLNNAGNPTTLQTDDDIVNRTGFVFAQATVDLSEGLSITAGASLNQLKLSVTRLSTNPITIKSRKYSNEFAPRIALIQKFGSNSIYASVSKGFSPPTSSEVLPSSGVISTDLEAEEGLNFELGTKGTYLQDRLYVDASVFYYKLKNAIVVRRDTQGRDYFVNAGATNQKGLELYSSYELYRNASKTSVLKVWTTYQYYHFKYKDFVKGSVDYSGKFLPSVPKHNLLIGLDGNMKNGLYGNLTYQYIDTIPVNDANSEKAAATHLMSLRAGLRKNLGKSLRIDFYVAGENLTDSKYCLGFDLNANGGRYYNTAPGRMLVVGVEIRIKN